MFELTLLNVELSCVPRPCIAAIAATAIYVHKLKPQDPVRPSGEAATQQAQPAQPEGNGKIADRVGDAGVPAQGRPGGNAPNSCCTAGPRRSDSQ